MSTTSTIGTRSSARPILKAGAIAGVGSGIVNVVVFLIAKAAGVPFVVNQPTEGTKIIFAQPLVSSLIGVFLGAVLLWLLSGRAGGVTLWTRIAVAVTVLYSIAPFGAASSISTAILLVIMHAVCLTAALLLVRPAAQRS
jgi:hypothetical protein